MRTAVHIALFVLGWVALQVWLQPRLPLQRLEDLEPKLRHLIEAADDYTAVAIGSSRVYREVIPEIFNQRMALLGRDESLFNLGAKGMRVPEALVVLEWLLERQPARLKLVLFELSEFNPFIDARNSMADREVSWHTWEQTEAAMAGAWSDTESEIETRDRIDTMVGHFRHWMTRVAAVGRGREFIPLLRRVRAGEPEPLELSEYMRRAGGWVPLEAEMHVGYEARQTDYRTNVPAYMKRVRSLRNLRDVRGDLTSYQADLIHRVQALAAEHDVRLVFMIMPSLSSEARLRTAGQTGEVEDLLIFNDPKRYPYFYKPDSRWDASHLTRTASRVLTARLVAELAALMGLAPAPLESLPADLPLDEFLDAEGRDADEAGEDGSR